jgi:hypothetical protein
VRAAEELRRAEQDAARSREQHNVPGAGRDSGIGSGF